MCNILYLYTRSVAQKFTTSIMNIGNTFSIDKEFDDMMNRKKNSFENNFGKSNILNNNPITIKNGTTLN